MTIAFDSANQGKVFGGSITTVITVNPALSHRIVVAAVCWDLALGSNLVSMTYGGLAMTQYGTVDHAGGGASFRTRAYYITAPVTGAQNMVASLSVARNIYLSGVAYSGVDQIAPWLNLALTATRFDAGNININVPSESGNLVVDFLGMGNYGGGGAAVVGADQVQRNHLDPGAGGGSTGGAQSEQQGDVTVPMSWSTSVGDYGLIAGSLRPHVEPRTRAVRYFFNIWDPTAAVRDGQSAKLQSNEVEADAWIQADGFVLGSPETYDDFVQDPSKSRIVSVTYRRTGLDLKTSKNSFGDVIVARAAAGRM